MPFGPFGPFGMRFDWPEFFVGLVVGVVAALILLRFAPIFTWTRQAIRSRLDALRENLTTGAQDRYRTELIRRAETLHIARAIFALEEVLVAPRVLVPPQPTDPLETEPPPEDTLAILPNLPDWNYLASVYRTPSLTVAEAFGQGVDLLLVGPPGSGKTTALAALAIDLARRQGAEGQREGPLPVLVHGADLELQAGKDPLEPLIRATQRWASASLAGRLPRYLRVRFRRGQAVLLLDGLDTMTPAEIRPFTAWLEQLKETYPQVRVVAAGPPYGYDGLTAIGLTPVPMAPWTEHERRTFLERWGRAWQEFVVPTLPQDRLSDLDPALINGWLVGSVSRLSPLELTLLAWAAYAGDARGPGALEAIESFLTRFLSPEERDSAAAAAKAWIESGQGAPEARVLPRGTPVSDLVEIGLLARHPGGRVTFVHPTVGGFLAAVRYREEGSQPSEVTDGPWLPLEETLRCLAAIGDVAPIVERRLQAPDPLRWQALLTARWLRDSPPKAPWRAGLLRSLAMVAADANAPYGLRLRAVDALAFSGDPSVAVLFQRLLRSEDPTARILGALGIGGLRDAGSREILVQSLQEDRELVVRQTCCHALAAIGNEAALQTLGEVLLGAEEAMRLAAAEALAIHPDEGYGMLQEAAEFDDVLTRRAAVFGLLRVPEDWAGEMLERMQVDDKEWVVRGAAAEAAERRKSPPWRLVPPVTELSEMPWLVSFAARLGVGVAPGRAALEMVRRALNEGTLEERIAAVEALGWRGGVELGLELYQLIRGEDATLRDAAYESLWRLKAAGEDIPVPLDSLG